MTATTEKLNQIIQLLQDMPKQFDNMHKARDEKETSVRLALIRAMSNEAIEKNEASLLEMKRKLEEKATEEAKKNSNKMKKLNQGR